MSELGGGALNSRQALRVILVLVLALAALLTPSSGSTQHMNQRARAASAFVDSIGINTHLHYTDTAYDNYDDIVKPRILELGVDHVRDVAYTYEGVNRETRFYDRIRDLATHGIAFNLLTSVANRYGPETNLDLLSDVYEWSDGSIQSFEGPNEPDISGVEDWPSSTREFQQRLFNAVKDDATTAHVQVVGPSIAWSPQEIGDISAWLDFGNWHPYPGGSCPSCSRLDESASDYGAPSNDKPIIITETGYHNAINVDMSEGHKPTSERAAGKYLPRLLFEHFNGGVVRTYLYELMDIESDLNRDSREHNFGLVRNDGSVKPAFVAIRNMIDLLADDGARFTPGSLTYRIDGRATNIHTTLLQKQDGRFYLALWHAVPSWNPGTRQNLIPFERAVSIVIDADVIRARLFRPNVSRAPIRDWASPDVIDLSVPDEIVILELETTGPTQRGRRRTDRVPAG